MKYSTNLLLQILLTGVTGAAAATHPNLGVTLGLAAAQGVISAIAHRYNPDGTKAVDQQGVISPQN